MEPECLTIRRWDPIRCCSGWSWMMMVVAASTFTHLVVGEDGWSLTCCDELELSTEWFISGRYHRDEVGTVSMVWWWGNLLQCDQQRWCLCVVLWWDLLPEDGGGRGGMFCWDGWLFGSSLVRCGPLLFSEEDISTGWVWNGLCGAVITTT